MDVQYAEINRQTSQPAGWHFDNFDRLREVAPIHGGDAGGNRFWLVTRMDEVRAAYQSPQLFSNSAIQPDVPNPPYMWIPEMVDAPQHQKWRRLLGPIFAPGAVEELEPRLTSQFAAILDEVAPRGECDFVQDVALRFPNVIFMEIMGLPVADAAQYQIWETAILHNGSAASDAAMLAMSEVMSYFGALIAERKK